MLQIRTLRDGLLSGQGEEELRERVAAAYDSPDLINHHYCSVLLDPVAEHDDDEEKPDWVAALELRLNGMPYALLDTSSLTSPQSLLVFPSPSRMNNSAPRPTGPSSERRVQAYFDVEIYTPAKHYDLFLRYLDAVAEENKAARYPVDLTAPGGVGEFDFDHSVIFLAMRHGVMIGYCDCALVLPWLFAPPVSDETYRLLFGDETNSLPAALFEIVGLSALPSHGGYQIALVLLYHAFSFTQSQASLMPVTHCVSHSASIITKYYLCGQFGFAYRGENYFANEDFVDTIEKPARDQWCLLLQNAALFLLEYFHTRGYGSARSVFIDIALRVYQLSLWLRCLNSSVLELLMVFLADGVDKSGLRERYLRRVIDRHFQLLADATQLPDALRERYLYEGQRGLDNPQGKHKTKQPALFGYDELLRIALALEELTQLFSSALMAPVLRRSLDQLFQYVQSDLAKRENYSISRSQLEDMVDIVSPYRSDDDALMGAIREKLAYHEVVKTARKEVFKTRYRMEDSVMNTVASFATVMRAMGKTRALYEAGKTKNFVVTGVSPVPPPPPPESPKLVYPDTIDELQRLVTEINLALGSEGDGTYHGMKTQETREYYDNLFIKLHLMREDLVQFRSV